eukprot:278050_1
MRTVGADLRLKYAGFQSIQESQDRTLRSVRTMSLSTARIVLAEIMNSLSYPNRVCYTNGFGPMLISLPVEARRCLDTHRLLLIPPVLLEAAKYSPKKMCFGLLKMILCSGIFSDKTRDFLANVQKRPMSPWLSFDMDIGSIEDFFSSRTITRLRIHHSEAALELIQKEHTEGLPSENMPLTTQLSATRARQPANITHNTVPSSPSSSQSQQSTSSSNTVQNPILANMPPTTSDNSVSVRSGDSRRSVILQSQRGKRRKQLSKGLNGNQRTVPTRSKPYRGSKQKSVTSSSSSSKSQPSTSSSSGGQNSILPNTLRPTSQSSVSVQLSVTSSSSSSKSQPSTSSSSGGQNSILPNTLRPTSQSSVSVQKSVTSSSSSSKSQPSTSS